MSSVVINNQSQGLLIGKVFRYFIYILINVSVVSSGIALYARVGSMPLRIAAGCFITMVLFIITTWSRIKIQNAFLTKWFLFVLQIAILVIINWIMTYYFASSGVIAFFSILAISPLFIHLVNELKELDVFINIFILIVCFLAASSLFFWFMGPISGLIRPNTVIENTWNGAGEVTGFFDGWFNLLYKVQYQSISLFSFHFANWRNTSIFGEAPAFALALNFALAAELFLPHKCKPRRIVTGTLLLASFSTLSTGGVMLTFACLLLHFVFKEDVIKETRVARTAIILIAAIVIAVLLATLLDSKLSSTSGSIHMDDYVAGFKTWLLSPIWGTGLGSDAVLLSQMSSFRSDNLGMSNTVMYVLATGGLMYLFIWIWPLSGFLSSKDMKLISFGIIAIAMFCTSFFTTYLIALLPLSIGSELAFTNKQPQKAFIVNNDRSI